MLSLSKIYCNKSDAFPKIEFRSGVNVIYAAVTKKQKNSNSHSLGKSILADLIDYMLVKVPKNGFFLKDNKEKFLEYVFFLEIQIDKDKFLTIRRGISTKIDIFITTEKVNVIDSGLEPVHGNLGVDKAKSLLDKYTKLDVVKNCGGHLRKGLRYCIRRQEEFINIFKARNHNEKDKDWKPYLGGLLGIDSSLISEKYEIADKIKKLESAISELEGISSSSAAALEAEISTLQKQILLMQEEIDTFSFYRLDKDITQELVEEVGVEVSSINEQIYVIEQKLLDINESLQSNYDFDIENVKNIYESISVNLPEQLVKSYADLIELNIEMTKGRKEQLLLAKEKLTDKLKFCSNKREELSARQEELSSILVEKESFKKYKLLQSKVSKKEANLAVLEERLAKIDTASELKKCLHSTESEEEKVIERIEALGRQKNNTTLDSIVSKFNDIIKSTVNIDSYFYFEFNKEGNPEYKIGMVDETTVNKGHSYTKLMSAALDVSLLVHYSDSGYYRFAYHDGIYESLEDRVKVKVIEKWREIAEKNKLQLIITVLDSDIPEGEDGQKIHFKQHEIIRELHDRGDAGRLFRIPKF
ncbi:DUF2326 domain-containing protein [Vibrio parahaemolyticus]|uniref:DUF2326 domain-containing protein n=1 Tax=Vibrio parahaemolyticus TaxID=670 RepID=A0AA46UHX3_VIBPH|nr:DUF2326 domain-containing protein [Vibrio parahaemolyticus]ELA9874939.1 DUF2326 domain-containing protein [Vibrio parahaemolyticus]MCC3846503.1 DUF2326 domain-containing protein [Vibrio parahaemolyticus]UYV25848.1 DUF2326 domain-containing protein [Vibrio parahaemolyticus]HCJ4873305.1 DUF2326 domain-containing protein [Vibrio parahaemolyticus]